VLSSHHVRAPLHPARGERRSGGHPSAWPSCPTSRRAACSDATWGCASSRAWCTRMPPGPSPIPRVSSASGPAARRHVLELLALRLRPAVVGPGGARAGRSGRFRLRGSSTAPKPCPAAPSARASKSPAGTARVRLW